MSDTGDRLLELGYARAEGGRRGRVYVPGDGSAHVVKLVPGDDAAYLSLVRYAIDHPSPHLPVVLHGPEPLDGGGFAVVLERLDAPDPEASDHYLDEAEGFLLDVINGDRTDGAAHPGRWGADLPAGLRECLWGIGTTLMRGHGFIPDPSDGNVLMRGDVPVLADIVCGRTGRPYPGSRPPAHDDAYAELLADGPAPKP